MNLEIERKIEVNGWIIKSRWWYMMGIFLIGILTKVISHSNVSFPLSSMVTILVLFILANFFFSVFLKKIETLKERQMFWLNIMGYTQISVELGFYIFVMHAAGGIESISSVFFFLPVVSGALIFGVTGSIVTALLSSFLVNSLVLLEFLGYLGHIYRYGAPTLEFSSLPISLTKSLTTSIFYVIVGIFAGYGSKLLFNREKMLQEQARELNKESALRSDQLNQLHKTSDLLMKREKSLWKANVKLDQKVVELKNSEKTLKKLFKTVSSAKKTIENERNKTLNIISNFTDPVIVLDQKNKISLFNFAAKKFLGIKDTDIGKEISPKNGYSIGNFRDVIRKEFDFKKLKASKSGNVILNEELNISNEGKEVANYKVITVNILDNGSHTGIIKIFYDITRERLIDKMKSDFISIVAHQLRTPLSAIKWSIGMVLEKDAGDINIEQESFLRKGYESNERMITLVNDILNVSRIEEGRFGYIFKERNIQDVVDSVVESEKLLIERNKIDMVVENKAKDVTVCYDFDKMSLAIQNLLDNALKYTPRHGKIKIKINRLKKDSIVVSVKDSGVGVPKEEQSKLFSKFFRASNVLRMETDGTGLGLFIVKNIIEKHGGKISVNSNPGRGTEFLFTLPIECKI